MSFLDINFDGFSLANRAACCFEKNLQFSLEIQAAKVYTGENKLTYSLLLFPGWKKICRGKNRLTFPSRGFATRLRALGHAVITFAPT